tara:strand:+ start:2193 stop:2486 length:294 start_codon:yes stop_codon:yes gene_type:complete
MKILSSQLVTTPTKTTQSSFEKQLKHYNIQEQINNNKINRLIRRIDEECRLLTHKKQSKSVDVYIQLQEEYDNVRRLKNLKQKLYSKHDLHWDEEYY